MPAIELILKRYQTARIKGHVLHLERILAVARIGARKPAVLREVVIDTGAPISVFPEKQWRAVQKDVRWLTKLNDPTVPPWCRQFSGATGGIIPCRLGTIALEVYDANLQDKFGPFDIVAMFAHDEGEMKDDILFGLGGGALSGRRLEIDYEKQRAILVEK